LSSFFVQLNIVVRIRNSPMNCKANFKHLLGQLSGTDRFVMALLLVITALTPHFFCGYEIMIILILCKSKYLNYQKLKSHEKYMFTQGVLFTKSHILVNAHFKDQHYYPYS